MNDESRDMSLKTNGIRGACRDRDPSFVMKGHHCHHCYELYYVHHGECRFLIDDDIYDLHPGSFVLVPPMALHYTRYLTGTCRRTVIMFSREDVSSDVWKLMPQSIQYYPQKCVFQVPSTHQGQVEEHISRILSEESMTDAPASLLRKYALQSLLLICSRVCTFMSEPFSEIKTTDRQILQAVRYISEHYMHALTTQDVARAVGFSPNYLSRKFRLSAGIGLHEYLVFVRLYHAAQALISSDASITDIALRCGFSDGNYFKDSFKKKYGVTPRNYRKNVEL